MSPQSQAPLSDEEFTELDRFLLADEEGERLPIDEAHGYITALIVAQSPLETADWLQAVWGSPQFRDQDERMKMTGYMQRMHAAIAAMLEAQTPFEPLVIEEEDEEGDLLEAYEGWCFGFMHAVADYPQHWETLPTEAQELLTPIARLALLAGDDESDMDEEEYAMWVELLPGSVAGLYALWRGNLAADQQ